MTYATFITQLRREVGDLVRKSHVDFTTDGTTKIYQMPPDTFPILEASYTVKLAGVTQTETTQFTIDVETGTITMVSTPATDLTLSIDCDSVHITNAGWIQIINDTTKSMGNDFFKEFVDETLTTTANMLSLSLTTAQPNCILVIDFMHRKSTSENWVTVEEYTNWRYAQDENKLYLGDRTAFTVASELFRVKGLKKYTLGTATTDTVDIQDRFLTIVEYGSVARYWRYRYKDVVELVSKLSTESSRTPLQELIMLSDRFDRLYEQEKARLKPTKPARLIPVWKEGGGRP